MNYAQRNHEFANPFTAGQIVHAVIRNVSEGCVFFAVPGVCSAVLSAKALGEGKDRDRAMKALRAGDSMSLKVKAWYPDNRQLVFEEVAEEASRIRPVVKVGYNAPKVGGHEKTYVAKPQYRLLPKGTMFLVDGANYLARFQPEEAAWALAGLSAGLADDGFHCQIFLEHRAWTWYLHRQPTAADEAAFKAQCDKLGVSVVHGDSDAVILQTLAAVDDSVGLTGDHFADYARVYPDLVGSKRIRAFDVTKYGEKYLVAIDGIYKAIKIEVPRSAIAEPTAVEAVADESSASMADEGAEVLEDEAELEAESPEKVRHVKVFTASRTGGLYGQGSWLLEQGKIAAAVRCFKQVAEKDARGFAGLADAYEIGGEGVERDFKKSAKYRSMRERFQKIQRERSRRRRRLQVERRRSGLVARCA